jgi:type I restriction enzyme S subunit
MIGRENHLTTKHPLKYSTRIDQTLLHFKFELALVQARGANTEGLTLPMLESIPVPNVNVTTQEKFAQIVQRFERLRTQQREAERQAEHLFQTVLHRAFRGEL